jgi:hypothetical protein
MTAAVDREVLREWRDRHSDVRPDREGHTCVRLIWIEGRCAGQCGQTSKWIARGRPLCEACTVERVQQWLDLERGEMTLTEQT